LTIYELERQKIADKQGVPVESIDLKDIKLKGLPPCPVGVVKFKDGSIGALSKVIDGGDVDKAIPRFTPAIILKAFLDMGEGLEHLHDNDFIHTDIKSLNMMIMIDEADKGKYNEEMQRAKEQEEKVEAFNQAQEEGVQPADEEVESLYNDPDWMDTMNEMDARAEYVLIDMDGLVDVSNPKSVKLSTEGTIQYIHPQDSQIILDVVRGSNQHPDLDLQKFGKAVDVYAYGITLLETVTNADLWEKGSTAVAGLDTPADKSVKYQEGEEFFSVRDAIKDKFEYNDPPTGKVGGAVADLIESTMNADHTKRPTIHEFNTRLAEIQKMLRADLEG
jgi:serine/threonine protein kinase